MSAAVTGSLGRLVEWGSGRTAEHRRPPGPAATAVLADVRQLKAVVASGAVGEGSVVFVPGPVELPEVGCTVVEYSGAVDEAGTEMTVGEEFFLYVQDYATSEYLSVVGPTLVRLTGEEDLQSFLADADRALAEGVFPGFLSSPTVRLADVPALGFGVSADGPQLRLWVDPDGAVSTSPAGVALGSTASTPDELARAWDARNGADPAQCAVCLAGAVDPGATGAALTDRPWLPRYLAALEARRDLTARGVVLQGLSGFGARLLDGADIGADQSSVDVPLLGWTDAEAYLWDVAGGRALRCNRDAAVAVEALLLTGSIAGAAGWVPAGDAERAATQLRTAGVAWAAHGEKDA